MVCLSLRSFFFSGLSEGEWRASPRQMQRFLNMAAAFRLNKREWTFQDRKKMETFSFRNLFTLSLKLTAVINIQRYRTIIQNWAEKRLRCQRIWKYLFTLLLLVSQITESIFGFIEIYMRSQNSLQVSRNTHSTSTLQKCSYARSELGSKMDRIFWTRTFYK